MFPKPPLGLLSLHHTNGGGGVPQPLGLVSMKICWYHSVRDSPGWLLLGLLMQQHGGIHGVVALGRNILRLCFSPERLYKQQKCRTSCLSSPSC